MRFLPTISDPTVMTPEEVEALVVRVRALCEAEPVVLMYLHGSHARGTQSALSDLDLAVLLEADFIGDVDRRLNLLGSLEQVCRYQDVDLVTLNTAGPIIRDRVVREGRLVFARSERDRIVFEASAIKEALDFRYFSRIYDDALFRQLAEGRFLG